VTDKELREALAEYTHDAWSGWMEYLFSLSQTNENGSVTITVSLVDRWTRQLCANYTELPEGEKASNRKEASRILAIVAGHRPVQPDVKTRHAREEAGLGCATRWACRDRTRRER